MISVHDFLGQMDICFTNEKSIEGYFKTIAHLADICQKKEFIEIVSGFYLNASKILGSARLSYFVDSKKTDSESNVIGFLRKNGVTVNKIGRKLSSIEITKGYNWPKEKEQELREFLLDYTVIGLEMMRNNLHHSRCLMASYRFQVRWASLDIRNHFRNSFEILSPTYNSWNDGKRESFLGALAEWPLKIQVDWAHLMVHLILPYDCNDVFGDPNYSLYPNPLSISEINHRVKKFGLQIDQNWTPNVLT